MRLDKLFISSVIVFSLLLAACSSVSDDPNTPVLTGTLGAGQSTAEVFVIPSSLVGDLIYFELVGTDLNSGLELTLFDALGKPVRESNSASFFGTMGQGLALQSLGTQAITTAIKCRGACIIFEFNRSSLQNDDGFVTVRLRNTNNTSVAYQLFAFADKFADATEPANNVCPALSAPIASQTIKVDPIDPTIGALETVEDRDCFGTSGSVQKVTLESLATTSIVVQADIYVAGNTTPFSLQVGPGADAKSVNISGPGASVEIVVRTGNSRAAPSANSQYRLTF